jgi:hypothetical protein
LRRHGVDSVKVPLTVDPSAGESMAIIGADVSLRHRLSSSALVSHPAQSFAASCTCPTQAQVTITTATYDAPNRVRNQSALMVLSVRAARGQKTHPLPSLWALPGAATVPMAVLPSPVEAELITRCLPPVGG